MKYNSREELINRLVVAFSNQPEVREISIFGRNADGSADEYSDIDIRIHSNSLLATQRNYLSLIGKISPVLETFMLASDTDNFAQMIMLEDFSPYQKIDFGICSGECHFRPSVTKYSNSNASRDNSRLQVVPITRYVGDNLTDYLFGATRMIKCFFRKDFDMYRRWYVMSNLLLVLLYEKYHGFKKETQKHELSVQESKKLFFELSQIDSHKLDSIFPLNRKLSLMDSFMNCLEMYIEISKDKAKFFRMSINKTFAKYISNFIISEAIKLRLSGF